MAIQRMITPAGTSAASPYEALFARFAGAIPQAYLRTLAYKESGFRPDVVHPRSRATGLFQITQTALDGWNRAKRTKHTLTHLKDPALNTQVAVHHLGNVIAGYKRVRSLNPDWTSRRWLELLTLGWNAGHNAIIALAKKLEAAGIPPARVTVEAASELARVTGRGKYVADPARVGWAKSVAEMFLGGGVRPVPARRSEPLVASMVPGVGGGSVAIIFSAVAAGAALVFARKAETHDDRRRANKPR
ncbi:MAG: transglycosylase SLT domain-containing protein [Kofleriaceae bacterium]|nr:transglycosylase SLT domain-containing protein [Kofleriaceae bacterium]